MRPHVRPILFLPVGLLFFVLSAPPLHAQENGIQHPLAFAERTYGDGIQAIAPDGSGGFWFGGTTCSPSLPTTNTAIQKSWPGQLCQAGLLGRVKGDGTITYLSYFGGSGRSVVTALTRGANGNLYVAGVTYSSDFPTTAGAYDRTCGTDGQCNYADPSVHEVTPDNRHGDGFVTELTPDGSQIVFSTYIGGAGTDAIAAIAVDASGRINVAGSTASADFPVTPGAVKSTNSGGADDEGEPLTDAFFVRLAPDGSSLEYGTLLGGSGGDAASGVAIGPDGDTYVGGTTGSADFSTFNAVKPNSPSTRASTFLAKFSLSGPVYSTYVADANAGAGLAVVDTSVYIGGTEASEHPNVGDESYISELDAATGASRRKVAFRAVGATHGGTGTWAYGEALAVDRNHVAYFVGEFLNNCTSCGPEIGRYPTTWDAYKRAAATGDPGDATLSIVDFRPAQPTVLYSTMLGGAGTDFASAVAPDGAGGAFFGGQSDALASVNGQTPPQREPESNYQSFVAHVDAQPTTMPDAPADIVLYPYDSSGSGFNPTAVTGEWTFQQDTTAAGGWIVREPDLGAPKVTTPAADPDSYFELEFLAQANTQYQLWMRMKADNDSYQNDSVWVQFSDSVDAAGNPMWRIGSTDATGVVLEDCGGCGEHGWGWNDNGYGAPGTPVMFATSGWHTIRIQQREDGISIDQIVLSSSKWAATAPGANKNDATVLPQAYAVPAGGQPLAVTITSPTNGATFTAPADITIVASVTGNNAPVQQVDVYANNVQIGELDRSPYVMTWNHVPAGTYSLTAVATVVTDSGGATATSAPVSITVNGNASNGLPSGWTDVDVGSPGAQGSASYANGTFTVEGAGRDVWGTSDAFNYVYKPLAGDGFIVARVATVSDQANWVKAGVMIRGSLSGSSPQAFMLVSHAKGVAFQRRTYDGNISVSTAGSASTAPRWVMLVRQGSTISGYESADGSTWTLVGSDTFEMGSDAPAFIGLAVSSHVEDTLATATFDSVRMATPADWGSTDIGSVPLPGNSTYDAGTFTITGSGADIWGTSDAFHYVYTNLNGDGTIVVRVASVSNVNAWVKAGVMIRETLAADSPHAFMLVSASKGVAFQRRDATGGTSVNTAGTASTAPHWVKLVRSGNTFTGYESADGTSWTLVGTDTIPMAPMVYVGLGVTSHTTSSSATCTFDNLSIH